MATLYQINQELMNCVDMETGEIFYTEKFNKLQISKEKKIENIALLYKNSMADAAAYKAEKDSFAKREKAAKRTAERCKELLDMELWGDPWKSDKVSISYRKSKSVKYYDINKIPEGYLIPVEPKVDKLGLRDALEKGIKIEGVFLEENQNIQIR